MDELSIQPLDALIVLVLGETPLSIPGMSKRISRICGHTVLDGLIDCALTGLINKGLVGVDRYPRGPTRDDREVFMLTDAAFDRVSGFRRG